MHFSYFTIFSIQILLQSISLNITLVILNKLKKWRNFSTVSNIKLFPTYIFNIFYISIRFYVYILFIIISSIKDGLGDLLIEALLKFESEQKAKHSENHPEKNNNSKNSKKSPKEEKGKKI